MVYEMSIETTFGKSERPGFHLGTDEALARRLIEERFWGRTRCGLPVVTIALMRGRNIVDVYYGYEWASDGTLED